jgi:hypothetical protein
VVTEWQTRQICSFLAAGTGVWGDATPLLEAARELSLTGQTAQRQQRPAGPPPGIDPTVPTERQEMTGVAARGVTRVSEAEAGAPVRAAAAEDLVRMFQPR